MHTHGGSFQPDGNWCFKHMDSLLHLHASYGLCPTYAQSTSYLHVCAVLIVYEALGISQMNLGITAF